jgi:predicted RNA-binding Zn-ribbon protein involved in translation (DUF1610 family)
MKIKRIVSRNRRDFTAVYECESCGAEKTEGGYDDSYFHRTVIPTMVCEACGKTAPQWYRPLATKYPDGATI